MYVLGEYISDICDADRCPEDTRRKWTIAELELISCYIDDAM